MNADVQIENPLNITHLNDLKISLDADPNLKRFVLDDVNSNGTLSFVYVCEKFAIALDVITNFDDDWYTVEVIYPQSHKKKPWKKLEKKYKLKKVVQQSSEDESEEYVTLALKHVALFDWIRSKVK